MTSGRKGKRVFDSGRIKKTGSNEIINNNGEGRKRKRVGGTRIAH